MADKELDFTSPCFNPLKALYTKNLQPPVPNVQISNNINEYAKSLKLTKLIPMKERQGDGGGLARRLKDIADNMPRSRNRDPSRLAHLMKVKSKTDGIEEKVAMLEKTKKRPRQKNVLERMEEQYKEGPLSILYNCIEKKKQLKVWTRRLRGLRGVCVGYLVAFDKHMNLAMMDVDEMFAIEEEVLFDPMAVQRVAKRREKKRNWRRKRKLAKLRNTIELNTAVDELNDKNMEVEGDGATKEILERDSSNSDQKICIGNEAFEFSLRTPHTSSLLSFNDGFHRDISGNENNSFGTEVNEDKAVEVKQSDKNVGQATLGEDEVCKNEDLDGIENNKRTSMDDGRRHLPDVPRSCDENIKTVVGVIHEPHLNKGSQAITLEDKGNGMNSTQYEQLQLNVGDHGGCSDTDSELSSSDQESGNGCMDSSSDGAGKLRIWEDCCHAGHDNQASEEPQVGSEENTISNEEVLQDKLCNQDETTAHWVEVEGEQNDLKDNNNITNIIIEEGNLRKWDEVRSDSRVEVTTDLDQVKDDFEHEQKENLLECEKDGEWKEVDGKKLEMKHLRNIGRAQEEKQENLTEDISQNNPELFETFGSSDDHSALEKMDGTQEKVGVTEVKEEHSSKSFDFKQKVWPQGDSPEAMLLNPIENVEGKFDLSREEEEYPSILGLQQLEETQVEIKDLDSVDVSENVAPQEELPEAMSLDTQEVAKKSFGSSKTNDRSNSQQPEVKIGIKHSDDLEQESLRGEVQHETTPDIPEIAKMPPLTSEEGGHSATQQKYYTEDSHGIEEPTRFKTTTEHEIKPLSPTTLEVSDVQTTVAAQDVTECKGSSELMIQENITAKGNMDTTLETETDALIDITMEMTSTISDLFEERETDVKVTRSVKTQLVFKPNETGEVQSYLKEEDEEEEGEISADVHSRVGSRGKSLRSGEEHEAETRDINDESLSQHRTSLDVNIEGRSSTEGNVDSQTGLPADRTLPDEDKKTSSSPGVQEIVVKRTDVFRIDDTSVSDEKADVEIVMEGELSSTAQETCVSSIDKDRVISSEGKNVGGCLNTVNQLEDKEEGEISPVNYEICARSVKSEAFAHDDEEAKCIRTSKEVDDKEEGELSSTDDEASISCIGKIGINGGKAIKVECPETIEKSEEQEQGQPSPTDNTARAGSVNSEFINSGKGKVECLKTVEVAEKEEGELPSTDERREKKKVQPWKPVDTQESEKYSRNDKKSRRNKDETVRPEHSQDNVKKRTMDCAKTTTKERDRSKTLREKKSVFSIRSGDEHRTSLRMNSKSIDEEKRGCQQAGLMKGNRTEKEERHKRTTKESERKDDKSRKSRNENKKVDRVNVVDRRSSRETKARDLPVKESHYERSLEETFQKRYKERKNETGGRLSSPSSSTLKTKVSKPEKSTRASSSSSSKQADKRRSDSSRKVGDIARERRPSIVDTVKTKQNEVSGRGPKDSQQENASRRKTGKKEDEVQPLVKSSLKNESKDKSGEVASLGRPSFSKEGRKDIEKSKIMDSVEKKMGKDEKRRRNSGERSSAIKDANNKRNEKTVNSPATTSSSSKDDGNDIGGTTKLVSVVNKSSSLKIKESGDLKGGNAELVVKKPLSFKVNVSDVGECSEVKLQMKETSSKNRKNEHAKSGKTEATVEKPLAKTDDSDAAKIRLIKSTSSKNKRNVDEESRKTESIVKKQSTSSRNKRNVDEESRKTKPTVKKHSTSKVDRADIKKERETESRHKKSCSSRKEGNDSGKSRTTESSTRKSSSSKKNENVNKEGKMLESLVTESSSLKDHRKEVRRKDFPVREKGRSEVGAGKNENSSNERNAKSRNKHRDTQKSSKIKASNEKVRLGDNAIVRQQAMNLKSQDSRVAATESVAVLSNTRSTDKPKLGKDENKKKNMVEKSTRIKQKAVNKKRSERVDDQDKIEDTKEVGIEIKKKCQSSARDSRVQISRKRLGDSETTTRPSKVRRVGSNSEKCSNTLKTKEAKLPGKVVTVRVLKVDRGKALVLKRRHVNQLFIRGDNVIMVAYEKENSVGK